MAMRKWQMPSVAPKMTMPVSIGLPVPYLAALRHGRPSGRERRRRGHRQRLRNHDPFASLTFAPLAAERVALMPSVSPSRLPAPLRPPGGAHYQPVQEIPQTRIAPAVRSAPTSSLTGRPAGHAGVLASPIHNPEASNNDRREQRNRALFPPRESIWHNDMQSGRASASLGAATVRMVLVAEVKDLSKMSAGGPILRSVAFRKKAILSGRFAAKCSVFTAGPARDHLLSSPFWEVKGGERALIWPIRGGRQVV